MLGRGRRTDGPHRRRPRCRNSGVSGPRKRRTRIPERFRALAATREVGTGHGWSTAGLGGNPAAAASTASSSGHGHVPRARGHSYYHAGRLAQPNARDGHHSAASSVFGRMRPARRERARRTRAVARPAATSGQGLDPGPSRWLEAAKEKGRPAHRSKLHEDRNGPARPRVAALARAGDPPAPTPQPLSDGRPAQPGGAPRPARGGRPPPVARYKIAATRRRPQAPARPAHQARPAIGSYIAPGPRQQCRRPASSPARRPRASSVWLRPAVVISAGRPPGTQRSFPHASSS